MDKCGCDKCRYCKGYMHNTRMGFMCEHPKQKYIDNYFKEKKIKKMPGFIGYGENFSPVPKNKTTPKWCPMKGR